MASADEYGGGEPHIDDAHGRLKLGHVLGFTAGFAATTVLIVAGYRFVLFANGVTADIDRCRAQVLKLFDEAAAVHDPNDPTEVQRSSVFKHMRPTLEEELNALAGTRGLTICRGVLNG